MEHARCLEQPEILAASDHLIRLVGPLDAFSALAVEEELGALASERAVLTVDLSGVDVLTSGGLAMLERCRTVAAGAGHRLVFHARPGSIVHRVLQVAAPPGLEPAREGGLLPDEIPQLAEGA